MCVTAQDAGNLLSRHSQHLRDERLVHRAHLGMILPDLQVRSGDLVDLVLVAGSLPFDAETFLGHEGLGEVEPLLHAESLHLG
jgi:hypothetical protein